MYNFRLYIEDENYFRAMQNLDTWTAQLYPSNEKYEADQWKEAGYCFLQGRKIELKYQ